MKEIQRMCAVLLVFVMFLGILPVQALAVAEYGSPTAEPEELVIDYGKSVMIELENLKKHIQLNGGATAPTLAGVITATGYTNGQLLTSLPSVTGCKSANTTMTASYGTVERSSTHLTYTPTKFLTAIEYFYGVYSFTGFSKYLLVEIRIIPATQVYYEAENFVNTQIQTIHTTDGGKTNTAWSTENDNSGTGSDTQSYDPVGEPNFDMMVDRKNIPAGAFFADFDGTGNTNRFSKDKVYGGNNFDSAACWFGSKGVDSDYIETTPGLLVIPTTEKDYHYVQTIISGKDGTSSPLALRPSRKDFLEVRFRTEGVKAKYVPTDPAASTEPILKMTLGVSSTANVGGDPLEVVLDYEALKSGKMITARVPLGNWDYYTKAEMIYKFRFYVNGILFNNGGELIIDYLYIGAPTEQAMIPEYVPTERKYLFFGFDDLTDKAYYDACSIDGGLDFSNVKNWYADYNSAGYTDGYSGFTLNPTYPGTISFKDGRTSGSDARYNLIQTGTSSNPANLSYVTTDVDYFKIRFKIEGGVAEGGNNPLVHFEYRLSGSSSYTSSSGYSCSIGSQWQEVTFDIGVTKGKTINSIRVTFGWSQKCTFTIDYIALYPSNLQQESQSYLFMDYGSDFAMSDYISGATYRPNTNVALSKSDSGLVMEDTKLTEATSDNENSTRVYCWIENLSLTPSANHYFQARIKIEPASGASKVSTTSKDGGNGPWFDFYFKNTADGGDYIPTASYRYPINLTTDVGRWITVTIPITHSAYNTSNKIAKIVPALRGTQGAKVTIDYIYVGPPMTFAPSETINVANEANPAARALYFGFDNDTADVKRYQSGTYTFNDTYSNINYDTGNNWATSSFYSNSTSDFTVNNTGGIVALTAATKEVDGKTKGPYFVTTKTKGQFVVNADTQKSLKYHPQFAEVFQIRFRLNGCSLTTTKSQVPELIFLFGGYDQNGEFKYHEHTAVYPYMTQLYHDTEEFQTVTVPLSKEIRNMSLITNFGVRFWRIQGGTVDIDYLYMGPASDAPYTKTNQSVHKASICEPHEVPVTETVYGYDEPYNNDFQLSNGKSMFVLGNGVRVSNALNPVKYTEANFAFTGTGFDIISRTGPAQATIRVEVKRASDGKVMRGMTVNSKGDMQLYQIPTVSIQGLTYGDYEVTIGVNNAVASDYEFLNRGNEFYLDAIRIYDTIYVKGADATGSNLSKEQRIALHAYRMHKEAFAFVREIRDSLLTASDFNSSKYTSGALFIDTKQIDGELASEDIQISENMALNVATYSQLGPKNEIYLSPGQAVAFKLNWGSGTPVGIDIGAKSVLGESGSATLAAGFVTATDLSTQNPASITKTVQTINTATALYYSLDISSVASGSYLVLYNASTGTDRQKNILSLTDLKISYNIEPTNLPTEGTEGSYSYQDGKPSTRSEDAQTEPYSFEIDEAVTEATALFLNSFFETPVEEDAVEEELSIYHSLNLASDISVNFLVPVRELDAYDSFSMRIAVRDYEDNEFLGYSFAYPEAVRNGDYYYFTLSDLTAVQMMDKLEATLYMTKDGKDYVSVGDTYSVADYAYGQLSKENASDSLKRLCADLLVYGAKAQLYKGYRTDSLADAAMTEAQRAYCSDLDALSFGSNNVIGKELEAPTVTWVGKALDLNSKVSVIYCVDLSNYTGDPGELSLQVSYLDLEGEAVTVNLTEALPYEGKANCYKFVLDSLLAAELRTVLHAQVYANGVAVSDSLIYSPDTYGRGKSGTLLDLCKALFAYSDSAKAYFAN